MGVLNGVLVNGTNYSWANVKMILFGIPVIGITKINYGKKQVKDNNYGFGSEPVSRGYGRIEYEASIEIYKDEWQRIIAAAPNNDPLNIAPFSIQVLYGNIPGQGGVVLPHQDTLYNCEFLEDPMSTSEGDTKILLTIPMVIAGITHDL
jgi:hypothetical protein